MTAELFRALAALTEPPTSAARRLADLLELGTPPSEADHTELFLLQLAPYASIYAGPEGMLGGAVRDRMCGFWRALGQEPPPEPDHLAVMLAFHATLIEHGARSDDPRARTAWRRARKAFLWEHLLPWLPPYLDALGQIAPRFYQRWGELLDRALREEAMAVGQQGRLALHLREAPKLGDPRQCGLDGFIASLLTPVRSGIILTRVDLGRAGRELELGTRAGGRRFVLRGLLEAEPRGTIDWLRREALGWAERHADGDPVTPQITDFWRLRAESAADLLADL